MKVWWVLAWDHYYPQGGLENVHSTYATKAEAETAAKSLLFLGTFDEVEVENVSYLLEA